MHIGHHLCVQILTAAVVATSTLPSGALAQQSASACGPLTSFGQYGPYDYRTQQDKLPIVEIAHFTPIVESLIRGQNSGIHAGGDLDYTLRAFPNHHRALDAMMRYGEKMKSDKPQGTTYSVECYFERAIRFQSEDAIARMLYARYLAKRGRTSEAVAQLEYATAVAAKNAFSQYNIGLIYFDMKQYDKALVQAHSAMKLGFPHPTLIEQLKRAGKWTEPAPDKMDVNDDAAASSPAPSAGAPPASTGSN